jgi:DNA-binding NtrC family response regulator
MSSIFGEKLLVAVYVPEKGPLSKVTTMLRNEERCETIFYDDVDEFKKCIELKNVNISICDIDKPTGESKLTDMQGLARELLSYKKGTYLILLTNDPKISKLTTLYRLGVHSMIFKEEGHRAYKGELERAIDHLNYWKGRFEQLLVDRSMAKELDSLFDDIE